MTRIAPAVGTIDVSWPSSQRTCTWAPCTAVTMPARGSTPPSRTPSGFVLRPAPCHRLLLSTPASDSLRHCPTLPVMQRGHPTLRQVRAHLRVDRQVRSRRRAVVARTRGDQRHRPSHPRRSDASLLLRARRRHGTGRDRHPRGERCDRLHRGGHPDSGTSGTTQWRPRCSTGQGANPAALDDFERVAQLFEDVTDPGIAMDVGAAIAHLHEQGFEDESIGIVGFCWGGRVSFLASLEFRLGAAVGFYGGGIVRRHASPGCRRWSSVQVSLRPLGSGSSVTSTL